MRKVNVFIAMISVVASLAACRNTASNTENINSEIGYDSLTEAGDTVTQNVNSFSTALHHLVNDVNQIPITGNADRDFAVTMKSMHQGAVDIAQAEQRNGGDEALKQIAKNFIAVHKTEIATLENYVDSLKKGTLAVSRDNNNKVPGFGKVMETHKSMMWDMSKMDTTLAADKQFVAVMIPHLQSGVYLSEGFLKYGKDPQLMQMAKEMIPKKMKQIEELKSWMNLNK